MGILMAASLIGGGEKVLREHRPIAGDAKRDPEPSRRARGGDADARAQPADRLTNALDAFQFAGESRENLAGQIVWKLLGQRRAEFGFDLTDERIEALPQKTLARFLVAEAEAGLAQPAARDCERDHFAVDKHAVAIEDDDLGPARRAGALADLAFGPLQDLKRATFS